MKEWIKKLKEIKEGIVNWDWLLGNPREWAYPTYRAYQKYLYKSYKENKMKEKVEMPDKSTVLAVARKCPDAKEVLKGLFPEAFEEKEIETVLGEGQIYKNTSFEKNHYLLVKRQVGAFNKGDSCWRFVSVSELGKYWGCWQTENEMNKEIDNNFTLCPHATIKVKENNEEHDTRTYTND